MTAPLLDGLATSTLARRGHRLAGPSSIVWPFLNYIADPYGAFSTFARKYGDPFLLPIPGTPGSAVTGDPEGIRAVFASDPYHFEAFRMEASEQCLGKHTLFFESGAQHKASRKVLGAPFHG